MYVKDWMTPLTEVCAPTDTVEQAINIMIDANKTGILIVEDGQLVGIFTEQDVLKRVLRNEKDVKITPLSDVMTKDPTSANAYDDVLRTFLRLFRSGYRHMPVVDNGKPTGMISTHSRHIADLLIIAEYHLSTNYKSAEVERTLILDFEDELLLFALEEYGTKVFDEYKALNNLNKLKDGLRNEFKLIYQKRLQRD